MRRDRFGFWPDALTGGVPLALRRCDHPDCAGVGEYRAPKSRQDLTNYYWFCLDHVRVYNSNWNYFAGMSSAEIEAHRRQDTVWQRPTWPLGTKSQRTHRIDQERIDDPLGLFESGPPSSAGEAADGRAWPRGSPEARALGVLDLDGPVTLDAVKARYKELVKRHHPDANGGSKEAEERLKLINQAYSTLRKSLSPDNPR
jgi:DnaJ domain